MARVSLQAGRPGAGSSREAAQIARLERLAVESGLDPEFAKKFMRFIVNEVIHHHQQFQK